MLGLKQHKNGLNKMTEKLITINKLDKILNAQINLSSNLVVGEPAQTFKMDLLQLRDFFYSQMYEIGDLHFSLNAENPKIKYGGTWSLINKDANFSFGDGSKQTGGAVGNNEIDPTLLAHSHEINHTHERGTMEIVGSSFSHGEHNGPLLEKNGVIAKTTGAFKHGPITLSGHITAAYEEHSRSLDFQASKGWTGKTSDASNTSSASSGDSAKLNVRGAQVKFNVWQKTA